MSDPSHNGPAASMDGVTRGVNEMYTRFPYPSPTAGRRKYKELANLLGLYARETGFDLTSKRILDGGTGTGHRLAEAALMFKQASFTAIDLSEASLSVARATAAQAGLDNVEFRRHNLLDDTRIGTFDIVMSMGVLHCLSDPKRGLRNLVRNLADPGVVFLYLYGKLGSRERMRRKAVVATLLRGAVDFERGIQMVKDLGFELDEYGWKYDGDDEPTRNGMIVDAFLNVNDILYDSDDIHDLVTGSGVYAWSLYGITTRDSGLLFDVGGMAGETSSRALMPRTMNMAQYLTSDLVRGAYAALDVREKYRLADLLYQPNGYTVVSFSRKSFESLPQDHRLRRNAIIVG